jgi:hypothetical protein
VVVDERGAGRGDRRPGAAAADDPALGGEVRVRLEDGAARDPEVACERARRGERRPRREPSAGDRVAQRLLQARADPARALDADEEVDARSGPLI